MMKLQNSLLIANIQLLNDQAFTDTLPGTLLKDFGVLLNFIGSSISVSKGSNLLPINVLSTLNSLLSKPSVNKLKRPQQKSFPHINGLFLLLRASGLTKILLVKNKPELVVDINVLESWNSLNCTEQYFALFESWWYRGSP